jgi:hypothetical protein
MVSGGLLPELIYRQAMTLFGETGTVELINLIGLYCAVSVNGFDAPSLNRTCDGDQTLGPIPRQEPSIATVGVSNGVSSVKKHHPKIKKTSGKKAAGTPLKKQPKELKQQPLPTPEAATQPPESASRPPTPEPATPRHPSSWWAPITKWIGNVKRRS